MPLKTRFCKFQGLSETALFALSEGKKIPKLGAVLIGMVPITLEVFIRVLGQAVVFLVNPMTALLSAPFKWFLDILCSSIVMNNVTKITNASGSCMDEGDREYQDRMNAFHGLLMRIVGGNFISPIHFAASSRVTKDMQRKVYALNRIIMSTSIFIELSICMARFSPVGSRTVCLNKIINFCGEEQSNQTSTCQETVALIIYDPLVFYPLTLALMLLALLSTVESVLMLCGFKNTPSDTLLFEQGDLPEKVPYSVYYIKKVHPV